MSDAGVILWLGRNSILYLKSLAMFCPKCGFQNTDTSQFCRACGEDLQIVAKALNKSLVVVLAGKIDASLEQKSDRFRRDAYLTALMGMAALLCGVISNLRGQTTGVYFILVFLSFCGSLWNYLAYRHSLTIKDELDGPFAVAPTAVLPNLVNTIFQTSTEQMFCPVCGSENPASNKYCRKCGKNLQAIQRAMKKSGFADWWDQRLDRYVRSQSTETQIGRTAKGYLWIGVCYSLLALGESGWGKFPWLLLAVTHLLMGSWDYVHYRRRLNNPAALASPTTTTSPSAAIDSEEPSGLVAPFSVIEATTRQLSPTSFPKTEDS